MLCEKVPNSCLASNRILQNQDLDRSMAQNSIKFMFPILKLPKIDTQLWTSTKLIFFPQSTRTRIATWSQIFKNDKNFFELHKVLDDQLTIVNKIKLKNLFYLSWWKIYPCTRCRFLIHDWKSEAYETFFSS